MSQVTVYGFPVSTYVNIVRAVLVQKGVPFAFEDLEPMIGAPAHLALHPFGRVPALRHGEFLLYETAAIVRYVDEAFEGPPLQPAEPRARAVMERWISAVNGYYYPWMVYHLGHERLIYPPLGIAPDERVVAAAMPKIVRALEVLERDLEDGPGYLAAEAPTLADFFMLPTITSLGLTPEGGRLLAGAPAVQAWRGRMEALPSVQAVRAMVAPHLGQPVEHARSWVVSHRPAYAA